MASKISLLKKLAWLDKLTMNKLHIPAPAFLEQVDPRTTNQLQQSDCDPMNQLVQPCSVLKVCAKVAGGRSKRPSRARNCETARGNGMKLWMYLESKLQGCDDRLLEGIKSISPCAARDMHFFQTQQGAGSRSQAAFVSQAP